MQSSYRIIKNDSAVSGESKVIVTEFKPKAAKEKVEKDEAAAAAAASEAAAKRMMESYETIAENILKNARSKADNILSQALTDAQVMKEDAYREGYQSGYEEGANNGYKEAYDAEIVKAREEAEKIIESANNTLRAAKLEYEKYLSEKQEAIVGIGISIARQILKHEIDRFDGIDQAVIDALDNSKGAKNIIIRSNSIYIDSLKAKVSDYQYKLGEGCTVNILPDDNLEKGKAVIERDNGKAEIDVDKAIENILEVIK